MAIADLFLLSNNKTRKNVLLASGLLCISFGFRLLNAPVEVSNGVPTIIAGGVLVYEGVRK